MSACYRTIGLLVPLCTFVLCGCLSIADRDVISVVNPESREYALKEHEQGIHWLQKGQLDKARVAFEKAIEADERFGPAHNNLGLVFFEKRDLYAAAWSFQRASRFMPSRAEPLNNLGLTLEAGGRLSEAIAQFSTAVELAPNNAEYLGNLIRARLKNGEHVEMLRGELQWLQFIEHRPDWLEWTQDQLILGSRRGLREADDDGPELVPPPPPTPRPTRPVIPDDTGTPVDSIPGGAGNAPVDGTPPPAAPSAAPPPAPLPPPLQPALGAPANVPPVDAVAPVPTLPEQ